MQEEPRPAEGMALAKGMTPEVLRTKLDDPLAFFEEIDRCVQD